MLSRRGQAAVEMIILLAISLLVLSSVLTFSIDATERSDEKVRLAQANAVVHDLTEAANMLYAEGEGARTEVYVQIPDAYMSDDSYILNKTINLAVHVAGKQHDVPGSAKTNLCGTLPTTPGGHWLGLEVIGGCVRLEGEELRLDTTTISFSLTTGTSDNQSISITNKGDEEINLTVTWVQNDLPGTTIVSLSGTQFSLAADESASLNISVSVPYWETRGEFMSEISFEATRNGEVVGTDSTSVASSIVHGNTVLYPFRWDAGSLAAGDDVSKSFSVCNNYDEPMTFNISLSNSSSMSLLLLTTAVETSELTETNITVISAFQDNGINSTADLVASNDQHRAHISGITATNPRWIDVNYTASITVSDTLGASSVTIEHYEGDAGVHPYVLWHDGTDWVEICELPDRVNVPAEGRDSCDLSAHLDSVSEANAVSIRVYFTNQKGTRSAYLDSVDVGTKHASVTEIRGALIDSILVDVAPNTCNVTPVYIYTFEGDDLADHLVYLTATSDRGVDTTLVNFTVVSAEADVTLPSVSSTAVNMTSTAVNTSVCVNATATDANLDEVWAMVTAPDGTETNYTMSDTACGMPADDDIFGVSILLDTTGNYTVNTTFANDASGNLGSETPFVNTKVTAIFTPAGPVTETLTVTDTTGETCAAGCAVADLNDEDAAYESNLDKADVLPMAISDLSGSGTVTDVKVTIHYGNAEAGISANAMEVYISTSATEDAGTIYCKATYTPPEGSTTSTTFDCEDNPDAGGLDTSAEVNAMFIHIDNEDAGSNDAFYVDYVSTSVTYTS